MHFTKTLVVLLLPLLTIASPTSADVADDITALDSHTIANLAELKNLQHHFDTAHGHIANIGDKLVGPSNSVAGQLTGPAGVGFKAALQRYRSEQAKANSELAKLATGLEAYIEAITHRGSTDKKFWD